MRNIGNILFISVILLTSTITMVIPPQEASAQTIANSTSTYAMDGTAFTNMTGTFWKDSRYYYLNMTEKPFPFVGDIQPDYPLQWNSATEAAEDEEEVEAADALDSEDEEELGSTFGTNADSFTEASESAQHYA